jgi:membrane-associated protein
MLQSIIYSIPTGVLLFIDAESLIKYGGLLLMFFFVFASTGLFFCFFLPSGAVLFAAGVLTATGDLTYSVFIVCLLLTAAAFLGNCAGYGFGWKAGQLLYSRKDSRFFKKQHLVAAENFYKKWGTLALTAGYFLPIIRSFAPVVAGMIKMKLQRFVLLSIAGAAVWILSFVLAGYFIGSRPFLKPYLKYIVIGFILVVTVPLVFRIVRELKQSGKDSGDKV